MVDHFFGMDVSVCLSLNSDNYYTDREVLYFAEIVRYFAEWALDFAERVLGFAERKTSIFIFNSILLFNRPFLRIKTMCPIWPLFASLGCLHA